MAGLYIHIPFCMKKCNYCDFISYTDKADCFVVSYCDALKKEMQFYSQSMRSYLFDTVFIGGGTPSYINQKHIVGILNSLKEHFYIEKNAEITIEANPGTLNEEKLFAYKNAGINRLSLGVQSMDDDVLKVIGRIHNSSEAENSFHLARECGFDNINIDIMYALPTQSLESYKATLNKIVELSPEHISAYSLILEDGTRLERMCKAGEVELPNEDEAYLMHREGIAFLTENGYKRYEISNYAKEGYECKHNLNYWQNGEYLGLGVAAHSAVRINGKINRWANSSDIEAYIDSHQNKSMQEVISKDEEMFEFLMLSLRKTDGFSLTEFKNRFGISFFDKYKKQAEVLKNKDWLTFSGDRLKLTDEGLDMQNEALTELM